MDINAAAKEYGNGVITSLKKNRRILIMMLLFAAGMIIGALSLKKADSYLSGAFSDMFSVYIRSKSSQSLGMNFIIRWLSTPHLCSQYLYSGCVLSGCR